MLQRAANPCIGGRGRGGDRRKRTNRPILLSVGYAPAIGAMSWRTRLQIAGGGGGDEQAVRQHIRSTRGAPTSTPSAGANVLGEQGGGRSHVLHAGRRAVSGAALFLSARWPSFIDVLRGVPQAFRDKPADVETAAGLLQALRQKAANKAIEIRAKARSAVSLLDQIANRMAGMRPGCGAGWPTPKFPSPYLFENIWRGWLRDRANMRLRP
jgi:hypothetical protein